jgi:hypothetical protein
MISLLKSKGYKLTKNDTLNNREFRESIKSFALNDDHSTFATQKHDIVEEFQLFLDDKLYKESKMKAILDATRDEGLDDVTMSVEKQERGFLITFTTLKQGV